MRNIGEYCVADGWRGARPIQRLSLMLHYRSRDRQLSLESPRGALVLVIPFRRFDPSLAGLRRILK